LKISVVIANYNNGKYIDQCINSLKSQTYEDIEIIFFDDNSTDNSLEVIQKYYDVKIIKNKKQTNYGSINQLNAFKNAINLSSGTLIFFLDSDDYFHEKKVETVVNYFKNDISKKISFDLPVIVQNNLQKKETGRKNIFKTYWPYIYPTSCITIRKEIFDELFASISSNSFTDVWMDLRISIFSQYILNSLDTINENLTYYRKTDNNISSNFKKFSKTWWKRRRQAHEYFYKFSKDNNLNFKKNFDFVITKLICKIL
jgi:glycosyltransferase involved in cell wall biosynthesis